MIKLVEQLQQLQEKKWKKWTETFEDEDTHEMVDVERPLSRKMHEEEIPMPLANSSQSDRHSVM